MTAIERNIHYFGGNREIAIARDGYKCVHCGMTREEHKAKWNIDISVDHIDGKGRRTPKAERNNALENLQTLCISCHSRKDVARSSSKGETHHKTKLTKEDIDDIRMFYSKGMRIKDISKGYPVVDGAIGYIVRRVTWAHHESTIAPKDKDGE